MQFYLTTSAYKVYIASDNWSTSYVSFKSADYILRNENALRVRTFFYRISRYGRAGSRRKRKQRPSVRTAGRRRRVAAAKTTVMIIDCGAIFG